MSGICVIDDIKKGHNISDEHYNEYWWDFPKGINIHENEYIHKMPINPEIKEPSSVKKDSKALDKLFEFCDNLPKKFKSNKDFIQWAEQEE